MQVECPCSQDRWHNGHAQLDLMRVGHSDGLETGAMSRDGSIVLTAAYDKSARVWDLSSGKCLAVLPSSAQVSHIIIL